MSRIGKKPVEIPAKTKVEVKGQTVHVEGPKGTLEWTVPSPIAVVYAGGGIASGRSGYDLLTGPFMGDQTIIASLERAFHAPGVRAVVFRVESPGGEVRIRPARFSCPQDARGFRLRAPGFGPSGDHRPPRCARLRRRLGEVVLLGPPGIGKTHLAIGLSVLRARPATGSASPLRPNGWRAWTVAYAQGRLDAERVLSRALPPPVIDCALTRWATSPPRLRSPTYSSSSSVPVTSGRR